MHQLNNTRVNYFSLVMLYVASLFISSFIYIGLNPLGLEQNQVSTASQVIAQMACIWLFIKMDFLSIRSSVIEFKKDISKALLTCAAMYLIAVLATVVVVPRLEDLILAITKLFDASATIPDTSENQSAIVSILNTGNAVTLIFILLLVTVMAPIFEELIFRKALIGLMGNYFKAKWIGYILSVVLFAGIHVAFAGDYLSIAPYLVSGASFTLIYWYSKENIIYPIVVHMIWNIIVTIIVLNQ